jgi:hypothetical protein
MDYLNQIEETKNKLKDNGFTEEDISKLTALAINNAVDIALNDLQDKDPEIIAQLNQDLSQTQATTENAMQKLNTIFNQVYGVEANTKKQELVLNYLQESLEHLDKVKDLLNRYKAGDPSAIAAISAQEGNPDVQNILE